MLPLTRLGFGGPSEQSPRNMQTRCHQSVPGVQSGKIAVLFSTISMHIRHACMPGVQHAGVQHADVQHKHPEECGSKGGAWIRRGGDLRSDLSD
eukprot:1149626-Pelagomonas_calceolata.AAC.4